MVDAQRAQLIKKKFQELTKDHKDFNYLQKELHKLKVTKQEITNIPIITLFVKNCLKGETYHV
jgi:hypothetical protein